MNDVEDLLREGMERFTRDLRAPAGLIRQVEQRRRRRLVWRSAVGLAAAACAASVVAVVLPTAGATGGSVALAASVVKRVDNALSTSEIAQMTITTRGPLASSCSGGECRVVPGKTATTTAEEWSYGDQWRSVTYLGGHLVYDEGTNASSVYTFVSYQGRTWARARQPGYGGVSVRLPVEHGCGPFASAGARLFQPGLPGIDFSASSPPATMPGILRAAVSCGSLADAGRQRVDGIDAIKLISRPGSMISETIWVSPGTYLPVRVAVDSGFREVSANITWLAPTVRNLGKLSVPIPEGFRHVSLAEALGLTMLQFEGGPRLNGLCLVSPFGPACIPAPGSSFGYGPRTGGR
jgi:hypothetical protein